MLTTSDISRSLGFYEGLLGGRVTYRFPEENPVFVTVEVGGGTVGIGRGEEPRPAVADLPFSLCVYAEDCDAAVGRLRRRGVPVLADPVDQPWGERMAIVADPDGYRVVVMSRR